jgi:hypothetical protein
MTDHATMRARAVVFAVLMADDLSAAGHPGEAEGMARAVERLIDLYAERFGEPFIRALAEGMAAAAPADADPEEVAQLVRRAAVGRGGVQ